MNIVRLLNPISVTLTVVLISMICLLPSLGSSQHAAYSSTSNFQPGSSWSKEPSMPTPRAALAAVIVDEKIYLIGGWNVKDIHLGKHLATDKVEVYNIKNKTWTEVAPLPQKMSHVAAAEYNGKLYVVGGDFGSLKYRSNKLLIYDPSRDKWTEGKPMPTARSALTSAFIDGILYAIGGQDFAGFPINTTESYDPKTDSWTSKAPMPTAKHHMASAIVDGKLYVIGGRTESTNSSSWSNLNNNEMYDPVTDTWTSKAPMPTSRSGLAAAASADGKIYAIGGEDVFSFTVFDNNEKYDPKTDKWTSEVPMPTARQGAAAVFDSMAKRILVIGGGIEPACCASNINEAFLAIKHG